MHEAAPAGHRQMGGGVYRAGRSAARGWKRRCTTGTGLAAGLLVLGTLLVTRESRSGDVAFGKTSTVKPDATDTGAGQRERAIHPVGGDKNRQKGVTDSCPPTLTTPRQTETSQP
jgi:hypothetical protein